jgi:hypothetical protein
MDSSVRSFFLATRGRDLISATQNKNVESQTYRLFAMLAFTPCHYFRFHYSTLPI